MRLTANWRTVRRKLLNGDGTGEERPDVDAMVLQYRGVMKCNI